MAILATSQGAQREWENAPAGLSKGVICDVVDLGEIENKKHNKMQHKIKVVVQLDKRMAPTERQEAEGKPGSRFIVSQRFTLTLTDNSALLPFVQGVVNRTLTPEERKKGFDVESLIGTNVLCQVMHEPDTVDPLKVWPNIKACLPNEEGTMQVEDYIRVCDRTEKPAFQNGGQPQPQGHAVNEDLMAETQRFHTNKVMCAGLGIALKEIPAATKSDAARLKVVNDNIEVKIAQKKAEAMVVDEGVFEDEPEEDVAEQPAETEMQLAMKKGRASVKAASEISLGESEEIGHNPFENE